MSRHEFRCFDPDPTVLRRLAARFEETGADGATDTYFVDPARRDVNLKVRDGAVDVKERVQVTAGLQQWTPAGHEPLSVDLDALVQVARRHGWVVRTVHKRRTRYAHLGVQAEHTALEIDGEPHVTVAVESEDPGAVRAAVLALGLEPTDNHSYVDWLAQEAPSAPRSSASSG